MQRSLRQTRSPRATTPRVESLEGRTLLSFAPVGPAFAVNQATAGRQENPAIASDADGDVVIAWDTGLNFDVYARRFNALGQSQGDEFLVPSGGAGDQASPSVAMDPDGNFVIAWSAEGIRAQRYNAAGEPQGAPIRVDQVASVWGFPSVAMDDNGNFVVVWNTAVPTQDGIYARLFAADGTPRTDEFQVPQFTSAEERNPVVVMDNDGDFIVAWESNSGEFSPTRWEIYARRFDAAGDPLGGDQKVNTNAFGSIEQQIAMALGPDGELLVTWWSSHRETGGEQGEGGIFGQFFDAAGARLGDEFRVNETIAGNQTSPSVDVDGRGNFLVAWNDSNGVYGRAYTVEGPTGPEFAIAGGPEAPRTPRVTVDDDGDATVAFAASGNNTDVFARRLNTGPSVTDVFVGSSSWSASFRQFMSRQRIGDAAYGFAIGAGAEQLKPLPWPNLNRISIRFNQDVAVDQDDLAIRGTRAAGYAFSGFSYDQPTRTATWTLAAPLDRDRLTLDLDADAPAGVRGAVGPRNPLDGNWSDGAAAFPSGDGRPGGDFVFRVNVLPGDVNRNGAVLADDFSAVKQKFFVGTGDPFNYSVFLDLDGSGSILAEDYSAVKRRFFDRLP